MLERQQPLRFDMAVVCGCRGEDSAETLCIPLRTEYTISQVAQRRSWANIHNGIWEMSDKWHLGWQGCAMIRSMRDVVLSGHREYDTGGG